MGTSKSAADFSRRIQAVATVTERRQKMAVNRGALTAKEIVYAEAAAKGLKPSSRIAGAKWAVRYDIKGVNHPTALLRVVGPFHLVEGDTRPHMIYRKGRRARGRGSSRANKAQMYAEMFGGTGAYTGGSLQLRDGGFRKVVAHPGTRGKGIWKGARPKIRLAVPRVMSERIIDGWREVIR